jgi:hypothetical protein
MIVLCGVDGAGKTSVATEVARHKAIPYYWKRNFAIFCRIVNLLAKITGHNRVDEINGIKVGIHQYNNFYKYLYFVTFSLDVALLAIFYLLTPKRRIIADRGVLDFVVDVIVSTRSPKIIMFISHLLLKIVVKKYFVVLIDCRRDIILSRRPDVVADKHRLVRHYFYRHLGSRYSLLSYRSENYSAKDIALALINE